MRETAGVEGQREEDKDERCEDKGEGVEEGCERENWARDWEGRKTRWRVREGVGWN